MSEGIWEKGGREGKGGGGGIRTEKRRVPLARKEWRGKKMVKKGEMQVEKKGKDEEI